MRLLLSKGAAQQLEDILDYIEAQNPNGARNVKKRNQAVIDFLLEFPAAGAATDEPGTRRVMVSPYPYAMRSSTKSETIRSLSSASATRPGNRDDD